MRNFTFEAFRDMVTVGVCAEVTNGTKLYLLVVKIQYNQGIYAKENIYYEIRYRRFTKRR